MIVVATVVVTVAVVDTLGVIVTVEATVIGFGIDVAVAAEVAVFTGIDMKELQKDVAGALIWLRILMMTVTGLHTSTLLTSRAFSWAVGTPRAGPVKARTRNKGLRGRIMSLQALSRKE